MASVKIRNGANLVVGKAKPPYAGKVSLHGGDLFTRRKARKRLTAVQHQS